MNTAASQLIGDIVLCPSARHFILSLVLVHPWERRNMSEKLLTMTRGYITFFVLNSTEHGISNTHKL